MNTGYLHRIPKLKYTIEFKFQIYFCTTFSHVANTRKLRNCPRQKILNPRNTHEKKIEDPRNTHEKKIQDPWTTNEGTVARWHYTHENYDGTRRTKFSTLRFSDAKMTILGFSLGKIVLFGFISVIIDFDVLCTF